MSREQAITTASKFLSEVYNGADISHISTLLNAEANAHMGDEKGIQTLIDALIGVREFTDDLIKELKKDII